MNVLGRELVVLDMPPPPKYATSSLPVEFIERKYSREIKKMP